MCLEKRLLYSFWSLRQRTGADTNSASDAYGRVRTRTPLISLRSLCKAECTDLFVWSQPLCAPLGSAPGYLWLRDGAAHAFTLGSGTHLFRFPESNVSGGAWRERNQLQRSEELAV